MKKRHTIILACIALFGIYALTQFSSSLNPYVSFAEAKATSATVQVKGTLVKDKHAITYENQELKFSVLDEKNNVVPVIYRGMKPDEFERAESVVVIGKYDGDHFTAEKLLVKCPSKYEKEGKQ